MIEEQRGRPPYGVLLAVVVVTLMVVPSLVGEQGEAILGFFAELLSPAGLLFLPVILLLVIQFLSSNSGSYVASIFSARGPPPGSMDRANGSPLGVAFVLCIVLFLLYYRLSMFGGGGEDEEAE